jgi:NNP family nitrate/nitrite transporter-like MFS transporter
MKAKTARIKTLSNEGGANGSDLRSQIGPLILLTTIFFVNFSARIVYAPLLPVIEAELGILHAEAGSLFFLISMGYFIALLGSGWFAARLNHRNTIMLSSIALGLALLGTAFSKDLWALRITLFLTGATAGLYLPSGIAVLMSIIRQNQLGKAIAIHELAPTIALVTVPLFSELILTWFYWQTTLVLIAVLSIGSGWVFSRFSRIGAFLGARPNLEGFKTFLKKSPFWLMVILFGLGITGSFGLYTMLPLYLVTDHGIDRNYANALVAFSRVSGLFMIFVGGWAADRFGSGRTMMIVFFLSGILTVAMGIASDTGILIAVFLQPMVAVCFFPAGFKMLSRIGPPGSRNIAVSLTVPISFLIGAGTVPTLIGYFGDSASFASGYTLVGCLLGLGGLAAWLLDSLMKKDVVPETPI